MTSTTQPCTICGHPSMGGLKRSEGKCHWHFIAAAWGRSWALTTVGPEPAPIAPTSSNG